MAAGAVAKSSKESDGRKSAAALKTSINPKMKVPQCSTAHWTNPTSAERAAKDLKDGSGHKNAATHRNQVWSNSQFFLFWRRRCAQNFFSQYEH